MPRSLALHVRLPVICCLSLAAFVLSCQPLTDTPGETDGAALAKAAAGPTVSSALPSYAHQGDADVAVRILGSGFDQGSSAAWERDGAADPKVTVHGTRFVSSAELVATISVAPDASIDFYDVAVTTSTRKKGIGMERFTVTAAQSIGTLGGNTLARAINDQGASVGYSMVGSSQHAFFAGPGAAMTDLGVGQAYDLDPTGTTAVVGVVSGAGVVWKNIAGTWTRSPLPHNGVGSRATNMARTPDGLIIGGSVDFRVGNKTQGRPALWREAGASWTLQVFAVPTGFNGAWIEDVNRQGQAVGVARDPYSKAYVWEADGTPVALTPVAGDRLPFAYGINPEGTVIVGASGGGAVYWKRAVDGSWLPPQVLESCGRAMDINSVGMIVGQGCENATLWALGANGTVTRTRLPGLGANSDAPAVEGINNAELPSAAGKAKQQGSSVDEGVIWNLSIVTNP
jgi:probable HAF family extracellular repeat protein